SRLASFAVSERELRSPKTFGHGWIRLDGALGPTPRDIRPGVSLLVGEQLAPKRRCEQNRFGPMAQVQLPEEAGDVVPHGLLRDEQASADLTVRQPLG